MAIPQITNPVGNKGLSTTANNTHANTTSPFDISELNKPIQNANNADSKSGSSSYNMGQKDMAPMAAAVKDPTLAVETLRDIINDELLNSASVNGYTELEGDLETLRNNMYLSPERLADEIMGQETENTAFSGSEFYNLLRMIAGDGNSNINDAIGNLLKAINFSQTQDDILKALSSNMKFLSEYFEPNQGLSEKLAALSRQWGSAEAKDYFGLLRSETVSLLRNVSDSLLNDERTQILLPLILHNISRYNDNGELVVDCFSELMNSITDETLKQKLQDEFNKFMSQDNNITTNYNTLNNQKNQALYRTFEQKNQISDFFRQKLGDDEYSNWLNSQNINTGSYTTNFLLGKTSGLSAIRDILSSLINNSQTLSALNGELSDIGSITDLVNYLNNILREMPDNDFRQELYENFVDIINTMDKNNELPPESPHSTNTMDSLMNFISKNINHPALKSIDNFNASNLLQSMLNAPGVMTPLAHFILPLQINNSKAFGELWVDNGTNNSSSSDEKSNYHLFLTFDINDIGRFEVDLYARNKNLDISILHPDSYKNLSKGLVNKINKIIADTGYTAEHIKTGVLKKPHILTDIFPTLNERRTGLNVKI